MAQRLTACRSIQLSLLIFLTASNALGQEPRAQPREALAQSLARREAALAERQRADVLAEVALRAQEMNVRAPIGTLTDLLWERANLQIALDRCRVEASGAGGCRAEEKALARVEASFREEAGLSAREFQAGRREAPPPPERLGPQSLSKSQSCTCALSVFSGYRWMDPWWGLECNNHASHGVCSNDVDSAHSPGTGAMTGDINLYFGTYHQYRECPDDGTTCFHGPSTAHSGQWGNVCSCDTWHSQSYNPYGDWYAGSLSDSQWVHQLSTPYVTVPGSCNGAYVSVSEYIKENDPWCCDDPMGTLWISVPVADGSGNSPGNASYQNCNGGSQSGAYPYCGNFGATLWVAYICSTSGNPPPTCDPQEEASCWDMGWIWNSNTCSCSPPNNGCEMTAAGSKMAPICY